MDLLATALLQIARLTTGITLLEGLAEAHGTTVFGLVVAPMAETERMPAREEGRQGGGGLQALTCLASRRWQAMAAWRAEWGRRDADVDVEMATIALVGDAGDLTW